MSCSVPSSSQASPSPAKKACKCPNLHAIETYYPDKCFVCFEDIGETELKLKLKSDHIFHKACIDAEIRRYEGACKRFEVLFDCGSTIHDAFRPRRPN